MTNRYDELINAFETKLRTLISEYQKLQSQNKKLKADLALEHESLMKAHSEVLELRRQNDHLFLANQLAGSGEKRVEAKKQINKMVREIDQCLALLND